MIIVLNILSIIAFGFVTTFASEITEENKTPIIGVLSQETELVAPLFPDTHYESYIPASYVKFLESAGARVIPVWIGQSEDYYRRVVQHTNGVIYPGGEVNFTAAGGYGEAATYLYNIAAEYNDNGVYYPVWGTCLGVQVLMFAALNGTKNVRVPGALHNKAVPLDFVEGYHNSKMFSQVSDEVLEILSTKNTTYNQHSYCITKEVLEENGISNDWTILTTNKDINNFEFISAMEHKNYPFYGIQFHPEVNLFEFHKSLDFPHSADETKSAQFFANFLVNESRKNSNKFPSDTLEAKSLMYNFNPKYTGFMNDSFYEQIYMFLKQDVEKIQLL